MAVGQAHKRWQDFKKAFPAFEKSKNFKADLGPQLDKLDKAYMEWRAAEARCDKALNALAEPYQKIHTAFKGYKAVADSVGDAKLAKEFQNQLKIFEIELQATTNMVEAWTTYKATCRSALSRAIAAG